MNKDGEMKVMAKKIIPLIMAGSLVGLAALSGALPPQDHDSSIRRLTYSGNTAVKHPCLSQDGRWMLYSTELTEGEATAKAIRIMDLENGKEKTLFRDGDLKAPDPYGEIALVIGTKPPILSGDGKTAVFALGLAKPKAIMDHYLAIADVEGASIEIISFPISALKDKDVHSLGFDSSDWERVSNYAISSTGLRIACAVKGHLGPRRYGYASGIVLLNLKDKTQDTLLAPDFNEQGWDWPGYPRRPLMGGGWAFGLSGDGRSVLFGAQSSEDVNDYDLYIAEWGKKTPKRITDFHDRWFSLADIGHDGKRIVFFYTGKKKSGIGTYAIASDGSSLKQLESKLGPRIEFLDMSEDGSFLFYKHIYKGMIMNLETGTEFVAYDERTPGYAEGMAPMDFPSFPSFWTPQITSYNGEFTLLIGPPFGKEASEIYLLHIGVE
ncbi:MAG: hypothetical protein JXB23_13505 [Candidatus Aminicenantes bacterium]|nr:hypothetical protein [Candidatus Aminicenantes bacterium]